MPGTQIQDSVRTDRHAIFDSIYSVLLQMGVDESEVNEGNSYTVSDTLACNATTVKWQITTPDTTTYAHWTFSLTTTGEATYLVTEGSDRTDGAALSEVNRNRVGTPSSATTVVSRTPTGGTTDGATTLFSVRTGTLYTAAIASPSNKWILKPNTKYVISVTTYASVFVSCVVDWYEH
jgi:hypothetical protein